jgi:hypothetical protein
VIIDKTTPQYANILDQYETTIYQPLVSRSVQPEELIQKTTDWVCQKLRFGDPEGVRAFSGSDFSKLVEKGKGLCCDRATLVKLLCDDVLGRVFNIRSAIQTGRGREDDLHTWNLVMFKKDNITHVRLVDQDGPIELLSSADVHNAYHFLGDYIGSLTNGMKQTPKKLYSKVELGL